MSSSATVHGPVSREVDRLVAAVAALLAAPVELLLCSGDIAVLAQQRARLDAAMLQRIGAVDAAVAWTEDGSRSAGSWVAKRTRETPVDARTHVRLRRRLDDRPLVEQALTAGRISYRHAKELCHWLDKLSRYLLGSDLYDVPALLETQEAAFLQVAVLTDPHTLAVELKKRVQAFAPAPAQKDADALDAARTASLQPAFDGGWDLTAALGEHAGQTLAAALNAWRHTDHQHGDLRTPAQRQADALVGIAQHYLDSGASSLDRGVAPHVLVHVPLARMHAHELARLAGASRFSGIELPEPFTRPLFTRDGQLLTHTDALNALHTPTAGAPDGVDPWDMTPPGAPPPHRGHLRLVNDELSAPPPDEPPDWVLDQLPSAAPGPAEIVPVATYADGRPVAPRTLDLLLCDSRLTRVVLDTDQMPLELGRTSRTYTWQQTQAALIRYRNTCATQGCGAPGHQLKMHHPTPWSEGGTTDNDAVPLCLHHHTRLHDNHTLQLTSGNTLGPHGWITLVIEEPAA